MKYSYRLYIAVCIVIINPGPFTFNENKIKQVFLKVTPSKSIHWTFDQFKTGPFPVRCGHMPVLNRYDDDADQLVQPSKGKWRYDETSDEPDEAEKLS